MFLLHVLLFKILQDLAFGVESHIFHSMRIVLEAKLLAALQSKCCAFGSVKTDILLHGERTDSDPLHRKRIKVMLLVYSSCF